MRFLLVLVLTLFACWNCGFAAEDNAENVITPRIYESQIREVIKCILRILKEGIPEAGLQSLDPLKIEKAEINSDSNFLNGSILIENLELTGITSLYDSYLNGKMLIAPGEGIGVNLTFVMDIDDLKLKTDYDMNVKILNFIPLFGNGTLTVDVTGIQISGYAEIFLKPSIKGVQLNNLSWENLELVFTGLQNDEEQSKIISQAITELIQQIIHDEEYLNKILGAVNNFLKENLAGGLPEGPIFDALKECFDLIAYLY